MDATAPFVSKIRVAAYARVSSRMKEGHNPNDVRQNPENQLLKLREFCKVRGWECVEYVDYASGMKAMRPKFREVIADLDKGLDGVVAVRIDRIGRSTQDLLGFLTLIKEKRKFFEATEQGLRIDGKKNDIMSDLLFRILSAVAEFERELIRERVLDGLDRVKTKGSKSGLPIGQPSKVDTNNMLELLKTSSPSEVAQQLGVSRATIYSRLKAYREHNSGSVVGTSADHT